MGEGEGGERLGVIDDPACIAVHQRLSAKAGFDVSWYWVGRYMGQNDPLTRHGYDVSIDEFVCEIRRARIIHGAGDFT